MIKALQKKFILITMISLLVVTVILVGSINAMNFYSTNQKLDQTLDFLSQDKQQLQSTVEDDVPVKQQPKKTTVSKELRYFIVKLNKDESLKQIDTSFIREVSSTTAQEMAKKVVEKGRTSGFYGNYKYMVSRESDAKIIVFLYAQNELSMAKQTFFISLLVSFCTLLVMFGVITVFSRRAIKPIIENTEKQKRFITDAGHEIKTPLAVISASADVLELTYGKDEWIKSIRNQTLYLDKLVKNLLILAKTEENNQNYFFSEFLISALAEKLATEFKKMEKAATKSFEFQVEPQILFYGDRDGMEQMIRILFDNAFKYVNQDGTIRFSLYQSKNKKNVQIEVYNTVDHIDTKNLNRFFERFYRSDESRNRESGGYGIGLSIAKSIVEVHHGKINAKSKDGKSVTFTVILPIIKMQNRKIDQNAI